MSNDFKIKVLFETEANVSGSQNLSGSFLSVDQSLNAINGSAASAEQSLLSLQSAAARLDGSMANAMNSLVPAHTITDLQEIKSSSESATSSLSKMSSASGIDKLEEDLRSLAKATDAFAEKSGEVSNLSDRLYGVEQTAKMAAEAVEQIRIPESSSYSLNDLQKRIGDLKQELRGVVDMMHTVPVESDMFKVMGDHAARLSSQIELAERDYKSLGGTASSALNGIGQRVDHVTGSSVYLLQNMGRIISDLPYGLNGIANNLEPFAESWAKATREAGGTGNAIKGVLSQMAGPMGLAMVGLPILTSFALMFGGDIVNAIMSGESKLDEFNRKVADLKSAVPIQDIIAQRGLEGAALVTLEINQAERKLRDLISTQSEYDARFAAGGAFTQVYSYWERFNELLMRTRLSLLGASSTDLNRVESESLKKKTEAVDHARKLIDEAIKGEKAYSKERYERAYLTIGYDKKAAESSAELLVEISSSHGKIAKLENQLTIDKKKESERRIKQAAQEVSAMKAADHELSESMASADRALGKSDKSKVSLADSTKALTAREKDLEEIEARSAVTVADKKQKSEDLNAATKRLTEAQSLQKTIQDAVIQSNQKAVEFLDKQAGRTLSVADATVGYHEALHALYSFRVEHQDATKMTLDDAKKESELVRSAASAYEIQSAAIRHAAEVHQTEMKKIVVVIDAAGDAFEAMSGRSIKGLDSLKNAIKSFKENNGNGDLAGYLGVASFIGQNIGGKAGNAITAASSSALAAASVTGNPYIIAGAAIISGLTSLFGGDDGKAQRDQSRHSVYDAIVQSALSGGTQSLKILQAGGYTYSGVESVHMAGDSRDRLLGDRASAGLAELQQYINALDQAGKTVAGFMTPSALRDLQSAKTLLEYTVSIIGENAEATSAYWDSVIKSVTGVSADTVATTISSALSNTDTTSAGKAFADSFEESVATAMRNLAISNLVNSAVMPILGPAMQEIVSGMINGTLDVDKMTSIMAQASSVADQIAPLVDRLSSAFSQAGITAKTATTSTSGLSDSTAALTTIQNERYDLETALLQLQGNTNALRQRELSALDSTNRSIQEQIYALQDQQAVAQERYGIETTLLQLQGNTASLRQRELSVLDPLNRSLQEQIYTLQDHAAATQSAQSATSSALSNLRKSIDAEKTSLESAYTTTVKGINDQLDLVNSNISKLTALGSSLSATLDNMSLSGSEYADRLAAQAEIAAAALKAQTLGQLPLDGQLASAMSIVARDASFLYASEIDYKRDYYKTRADLATINSVATSQLSSSEIQVSLLQDQLTVLQSSYDQQVSTYDAIYDTAQSQVDALSGLNDSILSISDAVKALNSAGSTQAALTGGSMSWTTIPRYATGGYHPGGLAIVGDGGGPELVDMPTGSRIYSNRESKSLVDVESLIRAIDRMSKEIVKLREEQMMGLSMIHINTRATADAVELANEVSGVGG